MNTSNFPLLLLLWNINIYKMFWGQHLFFCSSFITKIHLLKASNFFHFGFHWQFADHLFVWFFFSIFSKKVAGGKNSLIIQPTVAGPKCLKVHTVIPSIFLNTWVTFFWRKSQLIYKACKLLNNQLKRKLEQVDYFLAIIHAVIQWWKWWQELFSLAIIGQMS